MTQTAISNYKKLMPTAKELIILQSAESLVLWDMETMMPPRGIGLRSEQLALLRRFEHKVSTDQELGRLLEEIMRHPRYDKLDDVQKRNVYLVKKNYDEETKLPEDLVAETAKQEAIAVDVWKKAKAAKNFAMFKPELEKLVGLKKKAAEILMKVKETETPYDALIDIYEPKMTARALTSIFDELRKGLVSLLTKCETAPKHPDDSILRRRVPTDSQRKIATTLAEAVQYDVTSKRAGGRIDETEHPFTNGYYDDVRITTHYYEDTFASSVFSVLHEAGHAIYDQGLNRKWIFQPVGMGCSLGFHESQSRFVENIVGRSREFWVYFLPKLKKLAGDTLSDLELDTFVHAINRVKPSKIRIEADEVTYGLHVIVRFNIERDLFADKITVEEIPEIWNEGYKDYLGVEIENDSEGAMQDTHWATGYYGYFPTYALGNIYAAQMLATMEKELPDWRQELAKGNFRSIKRWLIKNVHSQGDLYDPEVLLKKITGKGVDVKPHLAYLNEKFSRLYGF